MGTCLGLIVGNRGFFPDPLVEKGRDQLLGVLSRAGIETIGLSETTTKLGSVETWADAQKCAALLKEFREKIEGVIVALPNFGDERGVADTLKMAGLKVPVLVQASPDDPELMDLKNRRDSFCGKMSVCCNLRQYGIDFSLTKLHTVAPESDDFKDDLKRFVAICRVVNGLRNARIGAIGARPPAFNTVRYSEKILQANGITVVTIDLSDIFAAMEKIADNDPKVKDRIEKLGTNYNIDGVPQAALTKMARLSIVIDNWMEENALVASAIQCWTSMQENMGICSCAVMGMMTENLLPSGCEVDVTGVVGMYALQLASGVPSALVDWNNNYGGDPDKAVLFHCSNWPKSMMEKPKMVYQDIISGTVGKDNAYGACVGRTKPGPMTFLRISTSDTEGCISGYMGEGKFTDDPLITFGGYAVVGINDLQRMLQFICKGGFEHHVAVSPSQCLDPLKEAFNEYLKWRIFYM